VWQAHRSGRVATELGEDQGKIQASFERQLEPLLQPAYRLAFAMLRDRHAAQDAVQEAALKAWANFGTLRPDAQLRPWFLTIVANQCRTVRRGPWWKVLRLPHMPWATDRAEDEVVRRVDLRRALARLPRDQRSILALYFYLDLPIEEVAAVECISVGAAKSRLYRALHKLRPGLDVLEVTKNE